MIQCAVLFVGSIMFNFYDFLLWVLVFFSNFFASSFFAGNFEFYFVLVSMEIPEKSPSKASPINQQFPLKKFNEIEKINRPNLTLQLFCIFQD
jgi:hypothetical protein